MGYSKFPPLFVVHRSALGLDKDSRKVAIGLAERNVPKGARFLPFGVGAVVDVCGTLSLGLIGAVVVIQGTINHYEIANRHA